MKVCYFGTYNKEYSRNRILIKGLRENGIKVVECRTAKKGLRKFTDLIKQHSIIKNSYDVIIVGFPGFQAVILAKLITRKPVIFDAFVSMYDSMVYDRRLIKPFGVRAVYFWLLDFISMKLADHILFDTNAHIKYVSKMFSLPKEKFSRLFVGVSDDIYRPNPKKDKSDNFLILFYGTYIPLHGIKYIIEAAKILEPEKQIRFKLIGEGQDKSDIMHLAESLGVKNIEFAGNISRDQLIGEIDMADVCLGIFGNSPKSQNVIPNKVFECVAMQKPVITADTPAIRELFNENDLILIPNGDLASLAKAILDTCKNIEKYNDRAVIASKKVRQIAGPAVLGRQLIEVAKQVIK